MNSESIMKAFNGTAKEMRLRMLLHDIRQAADEGEGEILVPLYKLPALHMPTLEHEILELAGFKTSKFKDEAGVQKLCISWR